MQALDEPLLLTILGLLSQHELMAKTSLINRRFATLSADDYLWRPMCQKQWQGLYCETKWTEEAHVSATNQAVGAWCAAFKERSLLTTQSVGIFAMRSRLRIGHGFGIHFFEPRYRWLVTRTRAGSGVFCYCVKAPEVGDEAFLCEARNVEQMPDGRADLELVGAPAGAC
jgi:hypothetical protein